MGGNEHCLRNGYPSVAHLWSAVASVNPAALLLQHVGCKAAHPAGLGAETILTVIERQGDFILFHTTISGQLAFMMDISWSCSIISVLKMLAPSLLLC